MLDYIAARAAELAKRVIIGVGILAFVVAIGGCIRWQFKECTGVGHSTLYCLIQMGK